MKTRVLVFPEDLAVGSLGVYHDGAWLPGVAARGNVSVPADGLVCLGTFAPVRGMACLGPNDVYSITPGKSATDADLSRLAHLTGLRELHCSKVHGITDHGLAHLAGMRQLRELDLYWTGVGDAGLVHLAAMIHLRHLHLGMTRVQGRGLRLLSGLQRLEWLSLEETDVDDAVVPYLAALGGLRTIAVWGTRLSTKGLADLQAALPMARIVSRDTGRRLARERSRAGLFRILTRRLGDLSDAPPEAALERLLPDGSRIESRVEGRWAVVWEPTDGFDDLAFWLGRLRSGHDDLRVVTPEGGARLVPWLRRRRAGRRTSDRRARSGFRSGATPASRAH